MSDKQTRNEKGNQKLKMKVEMKRVHNMVERASSPNTFCYACGVLSKVARWHHSKVYLCHTAFSSQNVIMRLWMFCCDFLKKCIVFEKHAVQWFSYRFKINITKFLFDYMLNSFSTCLLRTTSRWKIKKKRAKQASFLGCSVKYPRTVVKVLSVNQLISLQ